MKITKIFALMVVFCFLIMTGCTKPFVIACRELATKEGGEWAYTEEQAKAACADANRFLAGKMSEDKVSWTIDYTKIITTEDVLKYVQDQLKSLDLLLSYKDDYNARSIDFWRGFREGLEKQEKQLRWVEQRLNYIINYNQFVDKVGEIDNAAAQKLMPHGRKAYSLRLIYPFYDLKQLRFTADYVEAAKKDGSLKLINSFPIVEKKEFAEKIVDKDDPNRFIWKPHYRGWLIKAYKIIADKEQQPTSPNVDYIEIYRAKFSPKVEGEDFRGFEEQFVVAGFKSRGNDSVNIFVIDYDFDVISGFNPDKIFDTFIEIVFGNELYINNFLREEVMEVLYKPFLPSEKNDRKKPAEKPLYVEIVKMGEISDLKAWEEGEFTIPFSYAATGPGKFDIDLSVAWKKPANAGEKKTEEELGLRQIDFFKVNYKKEGNVKVIEYYIPNEDYNQRNIKEGTALFDTYRIRRNDFPQAEANVKFFSKGIKVIEYEFGGRWYQLLDKDGDGKFEKRRKIADPTKIN